MDTSTSRRWLKQLNDSDVLRETIIGTGIVGDPVYIPWLLKHRYIAVIVALNVPGNALIGGGGGIALLAGMSGLFTFPRYLAALALAVLPVPLFVLIMGS